MGDDPIANTPRQAKAVLVISLFDDVPGGQLNLAWQGDFTEMNARYMLDKARATLDDHWRMQLAAQQAATAPRVQLGNGGMLKGLKGLN